MGKVIRETCVQSLGFGVCLGLGVCLFKNRVVTWARERSEVHSRSPGFISPRLWTERLFPRIVTLTYWPSQLRNDGFQSSNHLHIQQAKLRWMRGVKAWMTSSSRRWKAVPRLTVRETNAAPEAEAWTRLEDSKTERGSELSVWNAVYAAH